MNIWSNHCGYFYAHPKTGHHVGPFDNFTDTFREWDELEDLLLLELAQKTVY